MIQSSGFQIEITENSPHIQTPEIDEVHFYLSCMGLLYNIYFVERSQM